MSNDFKDIAELKAMLEVGNKFSAVEIHTLNPKTYTVAFIINSSFALCSQRDRFKARVFTKLDTAVSVIYSTGYKGAITII